ncbi:hypothetical protein O181_067523 [Austropuccinia psidii MF-1]|uniref:Reverse transcriptase Ty1/copia-type domain-containing protein n=1 Tax=Austropuccinia psidii MF-1 TaxID=1389203 RepID=A0A9Q3ETI5_9BASI|nr:hypothetical protein [Austropuccinia psidii MF-1]
MPQPNPGDIAWAMMVESKIPDCFWRFAYASACFLHNRLLNSQCLQSSPHQVLFVQAPSISMLYPFGAEAIVNIPTIQQGHKLSPRAQIQSTSVIFPRFQYSNNTPTGCEKGSLSHIVNAAMLDITIPKHIGQVLSGLLWHEWKRVCKDELEKMALRDVWEAVDKDKTMKMVGHRWVFNIKRPADRTIEKFKACLVARGDCQRPGMDCTETYAPTASLMSLQLVLAHAVSL